MANRTTEDIEATRRCRGIPRWYFFGFAITAAIAMIAQVGKVTMSAARRGVFERLLTVEIYDCGEPVDNGKISAFERKLGQKLPADYREFLLWRNGGSVADPAALPVRTSPSRPLQARWQRVRKFFGIEADSLRYSSLSWHLFLRGDRLPPGFMAIADANGDYLCLALEGPDVGAVFLWDEGNDIDECPPFRGRLIKVANSLPELVKALKYDESDVDETEQLPRLVCFGKLSELKEQFANGMDLNAPVRQAAMYARRGQRLLHLAASWNQVAIVRWLLENGANVNVRDEGGSTPLFSAASRDIIEILVSHGANVNHIDNVGNNVLLANVWLLETSKIRLLVEKGADPSAKTAEGLTVLDVYYDKLTTGYPDKPLYLMSLGIKTTRQWKKERDKEKDIHGD